MMFRNYLLGLLVVTDSDRLFNGKGEIRNNLYATEFFRVSRNSHDIRPRNGRLLPQSRQ